MFYTFLFENFFLLTGRLMIFVGEYREIYKNMDMIVHTYF